MNSTRHSLSDSLSIVGNTLWPYEPFVASTASLFWKRQRLPGFKERSLRCNAEPQITITLFCHWLKRKWACSFLLLLALSLQYCRVDWVKQNQERSVTSPENFWRSCEVKQDQEKKKKESEMSWMGKNIAGDQWMRNAHGRKCVGETEHLVQRWKLHLTGCWQFYLSDGSWAACFSLQETWKRVAESWPTPARSPWFGRW